MASETKICGPWLDCIVVFSVNGKVFGEEVHCRYRLTDTGFVIDREIQSGAAPEDGELHLDFFKADDRSEPLATMNEGLIRDGDSVSFKPAILYL